MRLKVDPARVTFEKAITSASRIYAPIRYNCVWNYESLNEASFHPRVATKIVGLAFLSVIAAWEEFIEDIFVRYLTGGKSQSGYSPLLRVGPASSTSHAMEVLLGSANHNEAARFGKWNDYEWVLAKAGIFFKKAEPFSRVSKLFQERLKDAQIIRNRIAHSSTKARVQFQRMTNRLISVPLNSPMDHGFSPGRLLIWNQPEFAFGKGWVESHDFEWPDMYECYSQMFFEISEILAPRGRHAKK